jgi:hypothetical protein
MPALAQALRALNEAAYAAALAARKESDGRADLLKSVALASDDLLEGRPSDAAATLARARA